MVIPAQGLLYVAFGLLVPFYGFIPACQEALSWLLFLLFGCILLFYYHYFPWYEGTRAATVPG